MYKHLPSRLMVIEPGEIHECPISGRTPDVAPIARELTLVPVDQDERMRLRIGRFLLKQCPVCQRQFLVARENS